MLAKSDIEPAWTLLSFGSLQALRQEPSAARNAIQIANYQCRRDRRLSCGAYALSGYDATRDEIITAFKFYVKEEARATKESSPIA